MQVNILKSYELLLMAKALTFSSRFSNLMFFFFRMMSYFILNWMMTCTLYLKHGV